MILINQDYVDRKSDTYYDADSNPQICAYPLMNKIKNHFEKEAADFDRIMLMVSPYYLQMVDALVSVATAKASLNARILDLGCGSGNITAQLKRKLPAARITCLDISDNMLELARRRLNFFKDINYVNANIEEYPFAQSYDIVVSSLALHHVKDSVCKQNIYKRIYDCLADTGVFFNADVVTADDVDWQDVNLTKWKEFMSRSIPFEEINNKWLPRHFEFDSPKTLTSEITMLRTVGFKITDVTWKYFNTAVYGARK